MRSYNLNLTILAVLLPLLLLGCTANSPAAPFATLTPFMPAAALAATSTPSPRPTETVAPTPTPAPTLQASPTRPAATVTRTPTSPAKAASTVTRPAKSTQLSVLELLVAPGKPGRLYALLADSVPAANRAQVQLLISDDAGRDWSPFPGGLPVDAKCITNMNLDYAAKDGLYASSCKGVYRWLGDKWWLASPKLTTFIAVEYGKAGNLLAATMNPDEGPIVRSKDGGANWSKASDGIVSFSGVANVSIDPRDSQTWYSIIWPKYAGSYLRRAGANGQWTTMPTPLNNAQIEVGMTIGGATGAFYVTAFNGGTNRWELWRTQNPTVADINSVLWERVYTFDDGLDVRLLASGWSPQGLAIYAVANPAYPDSYTIQSLDGGITWARFPIH